MTTEEDIDPLVTTHLWRNSVNRIIHLSAYVSDLLLRQIVIAWRSMIVGRVEVRHTLRDNHLVHVLTHAVENTGRLYALIIVKRASQILPTNLHIALPRVSITLQQHTLLVDSGHVTTYASYVRVDLGADVLVETTGMIIRYGDA